MKNKHIIYVLLLAFFVRIWGVTQTIFGDEFSFLENVRTMGSYGLNPVTVSSLLAPWLHWIEAHLFGLSPVVFKMFAVLFGTLTIYLTYLLTKNLFDERTALIAAFLMAVSSYHIFNSTIVGSDEPHLLLLFTAATYFFVRFLDERKKKFFWLTSIMFGLGLLLKQSGLFILPVLFFYEWFKTKKFWNSVKHASILLLIGLVFFSIYPILSFLAHEPNVLLGLEHTLNKVKGGSFDIGILAIQYLLSFIWMGPLLIACIYLSFSRWKKHPLPSFWVWTLFFIYTFVDRETTKPLDRYFTILIVPLCIIGAKWIADFKFSKKEFKKIAAWLVLGVLFFFYLNNLSGDYLSFYPKEAYLQKAANLDFNFFIPISGGSGPIGFYLHALFLMISFAACLLLFISTLLRWKHTRLCLIAFLGLALAYNVVLTSEHLFSVSNPSVDKVNKELISYALENKLHDPVFFFRNPSMYYYLGSNYSKPYRDMTLLDYYVFDRINISQKIKTEKPTILVIDFPKINRDSLFWKTLQDCKTQQEFSDKGLTIGYVFACY